MFHLLEFVVEENCSLNLKHESVGKNISAFKQNSLNYFFNQVLPFEIKSMLFHTIVVNVSYIL